MKDNKYIIHQTQSLATCISVFTLLHSVPVVAQSSDSVSARRLQGVEVQAMRVRHDVKNTQPEQRLDHATIERLGLEALSDAVRKFAGVTVRDYGGVGGMKTVSVRNLGAHHTAVSYDGITVSNMQAGQIDISRFTLDNVAMLSMAIGHTSDPMQSARHYASAGVLNIETAPQTNQRQVTSRVRVGSYGLVSPSLRWVQPLNGSTTVTADASYMRTDGIYPFVIDNGSKPLHERRYNSDVEAWQGEVNVYHTFADASKLKTKLYGYTSQRGLPGTVILYNNNNHERLDNIDLGAQAVYEHRLSDRLRWVARMKYSYGWSHYKDVNVKYAGGRQIEVNRQQEYYVSSTVGYQPVPAVTLALAEDVALGHVNNNMPQPNPTRLTSLTALSARWQQGRILADANLVGTYVAEHASHEEVPADRKRLSPSVGVSYRLLPSELLYVRASWKNTFRVPTFTDMYYQHFGNLNLRPECATVWNVGLTWQRQPVSWIQLAATVDGYINKVKDKIVAMPSTYIWKMINYGRVTIKGLDVTCNVDADVATGFSVALSGAYTWQQAVNRTWGSDAYGAQIPYTPMHSGNASAIVRTPWITLGYQVTGCGQRYSSINRLREYHLKTYWEHSLTLSHKFQWQRSALSLSASVLNLTDERYEIIKYYPMPGRNWQVKAVLTL